jgi:hypothetical protein
MPQGNILAVNYAVQSVISLWRAYLQSGSTLRMYQSNNTPTLADTWADYVEATFAGYSFVDLTGAFPGTLNVEPGEYQCALPQYTFTCTGGTDQTVYGAAVLDQLGGLWFVFPFATPVVFSLGVAINVQLSLQEWALMLVP